MAEDSKSLYVKHRPRTLAEYSGPTIKKIVEKRFRNKKEFPHTIYIRGPRGTGKTTIARILSKYCLCTNPNNDGSPCEKCEMCSTINDILIAGNGIGQEIPGVTEVDNTVCNGKDAIQEIIDDAVLEPIYSEYKVIIFDECHMITPQAQNSLLKVIEDIPSHLICIFCTTDDRKVLPTIKSRMQLTLEATKQTVDDMSNRLMEISKIEGFTVSKEALDIISKKGNRVPRECINLLESVAKTYDNVVNVNNVKDYINDTASDLYIGYFEAANKSLSDILIFVNKIKDEVKEKEFVRGLVDFVLECLYIKHGISLDDFTTDYVKTVKRVFNTYTSSDFDVLLQVIEHMCNCCTNSDDDKINELLIITTAIRISKIKYLSNGLSEEYSQGIVENNISLAEHSRMLKHNNIEALEKLKRELSISDVNDEFDDITSVKDTSGLLESVVIPSMNMSDTDGDNESASGKDEPPSWENIDSFFDS